MASDGMTDGADAVRVRLWFYIYIYTQSVDLILVDIAYNLVTALTTIVISQPPSSTTSTDNHPIAKMPFTTCRTSLPILFIIILAIILLCLPANAQNPIANAYYCRMRCDASFNICVNQMGKSLCHPNSISFLSDSDLVQVKSDRLSRQHVPPFLSGYRIVSAFYTNTLIPSLRIPILLVDCP